MSLPPGLHAASPPPLDLLLVGKDEGGVTSTLGHRVVSASSAEEALAAVDREGPDAVVIAGTDRRIDGLVLVRRLRERGRMLPVLMLADAGGSAEAIEALAAGADDHVARAITAAEFDARLRALVRARRWAIGEGDTIRAGDIVVTPGHFRAWRGDRALDLARLEFRLLTELARAAGSYLTRPVLVERVWGHAVAPAANIVDAQVRGLRRKLTAAGEDDPIATKRRVGYMLRG